MKIPSGKGGWQKLTTEEVFAMLTEYNQSNRPLDPGWCKTITGRMNDGSWDWNNPEPIIISKPNAKRIKKLLQGQHRLTGFFDSDLTECVFYVMEGVPESAYEVMDQGRKRTASDFLCRTLGVKTGDKQADGTSSVKHHKIAIRVALAMLRLSGGGSLPVKYRDNPAEQARLTQKHQRVIERVIKALPPYRNDCYATPVAAAFVNAARRYGLSNLIPLVRRYNLERWRDTDDKTDPLKLLHKLIRSYNAKDPATRRRINTQKVMYGYAMASIRAALCKPEHWLERLNPPKSATDFGQNPQWERRVSQNITIRPEPEQ